MIMKRFDTHAFMRMSQVLGRMQVGAARQQDKQLNDEIIQLMTELMSDVHGGLGNVGLPFTAKMAARPGLSWNKQSTYRQLSQWVEEYCSRMYDEMETNAYFSIDASNVKLFTQPNLFGDQVNAKFPSSAFDIEEAGKCLALSRGTACVFHLMRVLEVGLYSLAKDLSIPNIQENWQNVIEQIEKSIRGLPKSDKRKQPYSEVAAHFIHVKDAWRNSTMHIGQAYPDEKAQQIFENVKGLMQVLATRLGETTSTLQGSATAPFQ